MRRGQVREQQSALTKFDAHGRCARFIVGETRTHYTRGTQHRARFTGARVCQYWSMRGGLFDGVQLRDLQRVLLAEWMVRWKPCNWNGRLVQIETDELFGMVLSIGL